MKKVNKLNLKEGKKVSWKKAFSNAMDEIKDELYNQCSKVYSVNEAMFSEIYEKVTENYNITTIESVEDLKSDKFSKLVINIMLSHKDKIKECLEEAYEFTHRAPIIIMDTVFTTSTGMEERELNLFKKRCTLAHKAIVSQIEYFLQETVQQFSSNMEDYLDSLMTSLEFLDDLNNNKIKENEEDITNDSCNLTYKKIFSYKEMEKLALSNNYVYKWSNGSHNVYEHAHSNKIVVIPAHELGLGLSIKIQKQILSNVS